jgi:hypothetical protein
MKLLPMVLLALLCCTAATCQRNVRGPIPAQCDPIGYDVCKSQAKWTGDPNDPRTWDTLPQTLRQSREETRTCEVRRKALYQCLERLQKRGVIVL